jgi:hypothetical protein
MVASYVQPIKGGRVHNCEEIFDIIVDRTQDDTRNAPGREETNWDSHDNICLASVEVKRHEAWMVTNFERSALQEQHIFRFRRGHDGEIELSGFSIDESRLVFLRIGTEVSHNPFRGRRGIINEVGKGSMTETDRARARDGASSSSSRLELREDIDAAHIVARSNGSSRHV